MVGCVLPVSGVDSSPFTKGSLLLYTVFKKVVSNMKDKLTVEFNNTVSKVRILTIVFSGGLKVAIKAFIVVCGIVLCVTIKLVAGDCVLPLCSVVACYTNVGSISFVIRKLSGAGTTVVVAAGTSGVYTTLSRRFNRNMAGVRTGNCCRGGDLATICFIMGEFRVAGLGGVIGGDSGGTFIAVSRMDSFVKDDLGGKGWELVTYFFTRFVWWLVRGLLEEEGFVGGFVRRFGRFTLGNGVVSVTINVVVNNTFADIIASLASGFVGPLLGFVANTTGCANTSVTDFTSSFVSTFIGFVVVTFILFYLLGIVGGLARVNRRGRRIPTTPAAGRYPCYYDRVSVGTAHYPRYASILRRGTSTR